MRVVITRNATAAGHAIGDLTVDGRWECFSREEAVRSDRVFVPGESSLPVGFYNVSLSFSRRYRREMVLLASTRPMLDAAGGGNTQLLRVGMFLHPGHPLIDADGLMLLGQAAEGGTVKRTRAAHASLLGKIKAAIARGEAVDAEIKQGAANERRKT